MAKEVYSKVYESREMSQTQNPIEEDNSSIETELDFVERPTEDFFCPVTFELLLDPHQTTCCGNHLSDKAVRRLQRDGKPCPVCNEPQLSTMPDKFHRRRVSAVLVRCSHTHSGCEWVGEAGVLSQHILTCPKRPWSCRYCEFTSTSDAKKNHAEQCTKYPVPCPNECEIGTVPRCHVEQHRTECPLESVACGFVEVGCSVKIARRDLKQHMEESQQQHLLSATLLNLKLTKATIAELNRQLNKKDRKLDEKDRKLDEKDRKLDEKDRKLDEMGRKLDEKDHQLDDKDRQLVQKDGLLLEKDESIAAKDKVIAEKDKAFALMVAEKDKVIAEKENRLLQLDTEFKQGWQEFMGSSRIALDVLLSLKVSGEFVLENFSFIQHIGSYGDWFSNPFNVDGYSLKLNVETKQKEENMMVRLYPEVGHFPSSISMTVVALIQLLNQLGDNYHYSKKIAIEIKSGKQYSDPYSFIPFHELYRRDQTVRYLKDDSIKLRMWIVKSS